MPPSHAIKVGHSERVELDSERKLRARNKASYRLNHWPIWIWTFFIAPGPLTFDLFAKGFDWRMAAWLGVVLACDGRGGPAREAARRRAGAVHHPVHRGPSESALPSHLLHVRVERRHHLRGAEHRRAGLGDRDRRVAAAADLRRRVFSDGGQPLAAWRARPAAAREAVDEERRARAPVLLRLGLGRVHRAARALAAVERPAALARHGRRSSSCVFVGILAWVGNLARRGLLPRTRPIVPGELAISDCRRS